MGHVEQVALVWAGEGGGVSWAVSPSPRTISRMDGLTHPDPRRLEGSPSGAY